MPAQNQELVKLVTSRQSHLETLKVNHNQRMQDVADFVCPHRDDILGTLQRGLEKGKKIYDGTAQSAAVLAADGIHGYHVSPAFPWFKYVMNRKQANKIKEVREWLQEIEWNMYMALNRSNFYSEMWSYIYDGFTIGTAAIYAEEDLADGRIIFESLHPGEVFIEENKYGEVDVLHRKRKMNARKIIQKFGENACPVQVRDSYKNAPFQEFDIIHAVFPREEFDDRKIDSANKRFASIWLLCAGNHLLSVAGFDLFPYHVWRYLKTGKEPYGTSPAHLAMADIKGVNLMAKTLQGAAQLAIDPAYNVPSYLEGKVQLLPRGMNYVTNQDKITPVNTGSNYPVGPEREEAKQRSIKERFHVDTFLMLAQLEGRGQRTAYEVSELMAEKAAVLGAELGPLNTELDSVLDYCYELELNARRMPPPPDVLLDLANDDPTLRFDPIYMGPLAQAQRDKFAKEGIRKFFLEITPLVQVKPETLDNLKADDTFRYLAEIDNVPEELLEDAQAVQRVRKARTDAMAQQNMADSMEQGASTIKTISDASKDGGLQSLFGGMGGA